MDFLSFTFQRGATTVSKMTLGIMALGIANEKCNAQYNITLSVAIKHL
jgi:hypothetical protein